MLVVKLYQSRQFSTHGGKRHGAGSCLDGAGGQQASANYQVQAMHCAVKQSCDVFFLVSLTVGMVESGQGQESWRKTGQESSFSKFLSL